MRPIDLVRSRIPNHRASGTGYSACCPAHEDRSPSLSFSEAEDGKVLIQCHAGCSLKAVLASIELTQSDLFPKDFLQVVHVPFFLRQLRVLCRGTAPAAAFAENLLIERDGDFDNFDYLALRDEIRRKRRNEIGEFRVTGLTPSLLLEASRDA